MDERRPIDHASEESPNSIGPELTTIEIKRAKFFSNNSNDSRENVKTSEGGETVEDELLCDTMPHLKKKLIVFLVALSCFLSPSSNVAFLPAVPILAKRFDTTSNIINLSNAIYAVVMAISPCLMSPFSDVYGRRITFLICSMGFTICTILVAVSVNLGMFFFFRCATALFGTAFFAVGGSIISDIYRPHERGNAMGWILSGSQIGPAIAPCLGGIIVTYTSWRVIFWVLVGLGCLSFCMSWLFLPETAQATIAQIIREESPNKRFVWVSYNPLTVVGALRYPNLVLAGLVSGSLLYNMYALLTPIRHVVDPRFNLTTPIYGSLFYLPPGLGYLCGSFVGGKWADYHVKKYQIIKGERIPEDRLRSMLVTFGVILPGTILVYGWALEKERGGIALPIVAMFIGGIGQTICFPSINAYCVDAMPELKGDAIASNYFTRYIAGAVGTATCLIQIDSIGIGWTCTISCFVLLGGFIASVALVYWGARMRTIRVSDSRK
ncbi:LADA_0D13322g1_1 [Lachancea dasiensis]|uniref:LADA_0D13322g1_1 n=1 Tax=Lachancea dasiensis TaxID=1072105 RepID=A0A1G4J8F5_9SACH|nr:LADA_0D13322g1_1 [Lachancea dasiensis]